MRAKERERGKKKEKEEWLDGREGGSEKGKSVAAYCYSPLFTYFSHTFFHLPQIIASLQQPPTHARERRAAAAASP